MIDANKLKELALKSREELAWSVAMFINNECQIAARKGYLRQHFHYAELKEKFGMFDVKKLENHLKEHQYKVDGLDQVKNSYNATIYITWGKDNAE